VKNYGWNHCASFDPTTASLLTGRSPKTFIRGTFSVCTKCLMKIPCVSTGYRDDTYDDTENDEYCPRSRSISTSDLDDSDLEFENDELEYEYYLKKMSTDCHTFDKFPDKIKEKYPKLCMELIKAIPSLFQCINSKIQKSNIDLCMEAIELYPNNLQYLWNRDPMILKRAVELDGLTLRWVYKKELTLELCISALKQNLSAIKYVRNQILKDKCIELFQIK
jgi:hypothetical protein